MRIGVLALQGDFLEHLSALSQLGVESIPVKTPMDFKACDALILPGGESTTMSMLLSSSGLVDPLKEAVSEDFPIFGTCAGMILLARTITDGRPDQTRLGALDISVRRNGFGRQVRSFEEDLLIKGLDDQPMTAVFIRAPAIESVGEAVEVLGYIEYDFIDRGLVRVPVVCRQGNVLASSFHPELTGDLRLHEYFVKMIVAR